MGVLKEIVVIKINKIIINKFANKIFFPKDKRKGRNNKDKNMRIIKQFNS